MTQAATPPEARGGAILTSCSWSAISASDRESWLRSLRAPAPEADVAAIVARVRRDGDAALRELTLELDGVELDELFVPPYEIDSAGDQLSHGLREALATSSAAIRRYHSEQRARLSGERRVRTGRGVTAWRRWVPIRRVGGYVPGGRARYPSSVLMLGIPALLAGVDDLIVATPPRSDGRVDPAVLYAASLAGIRRVLRVGGAQAIAAMAYGTEGVPRVDRIVGAGNAWVTAAKRMVAFDTAIDQPAGPSECVVVADGTARPDFVAADLLAQAEHGPDSVAVLVTDSEPLCAAIELELQLQAAELATGERALRTLREWGRCVLVDDMEAALDVADAIAPEHLSLQCLQAETLATRVRNAGAVFLGSWSAVAAGDYATGTNHTLPTGGAARAYSGLGVESFGHWIEVQRVTAAGARRLAPVVAEIAGAEGLPAHAASVERRAATSAADEADEADDPLDLLRLPDFDQGYAIEPSDSDLAAALGLATEKVARHDLNTLGGGPLPGATAALRSYDTNHVVGYGDMAYGRLRAAVGQSIDVDPWRIVPGAGADELIRLVAGAVLGQGDVALVPVPTFGMFAVETALAGGRVVELPRRDPGQQQSATELRAAAERASARLVWLCSPNNPTGDRYSRDDVRAVAADFPGIVLVDEAYIEFAEAETGETPNSGSAIQLQDRLDNVLVLRSFSKAYGIAGARVGYLVVPAALAERFDKLRLPLSVSGPAEAMALALLEDQATARERRRTMVLERRRLSEALQSLGCRTLPSVTNFVCFQPPDAGALAADLAARGLIVRRYETGPMAGWLRANALERQRTDALIGALQELLT